MQIENAEWKVYIDAESERVYLYQSRRTDAVLVTTIKKFQALGALIEQIGRIG